MKLLHKKMPVSVRFRLNPQGDKERLLQYIVAVDVKESTKFGVTLSELDKRFVRLRHDEWLQKGQCVEGNIPLARAINRRIAQIRKTIEDIYDAQFAPYAIKQEMLERQEIAYNPVPRPTWQSVVYQYKHKRLPWVEAVQPFAGITTGAAWSYTAPSAGNAVVFDGDLCINRAMVAFQLEMRTTGKRMASGKVEVPSSVVLAHFARAAELLARYQPGPMPIRLITAQWADNFHQWMQSQPEKGQRVTSGLISLGHATRHVRRIRELVNWLHRTKGALPTNPLAGLTWHGHDKKPIESLSREQLVRLENLPCRGTTESARYWFLVMAYTGLDLPDARQYVSSREEFEVLTESGMTIQGNRLKPPHVAYCIPRVSQLVALLDKYPTPPRVLSPQKLNAYIRDILAPAVGFEGHLTIKIARKTAGTFFLEERYDISEVSRILGHKKVATTEAHYVKTGANTVIRGMDRVARNKEKEGQKAA